MTTARRTGALLTAALISTVAVGCGDSAGEQPRDPGAATSHPLERIPYPDPPTSLEELPLGKPTTMPWWQHGVLHVGAKEIPSEWTRIANRGGTTVVGIDRRGRSEWYVVDGDRLRQLPTTGVPVEEPLISGNGEWITWLDEDATPESDYVDDVSYRVVLYDAGAHEVADTYGDRRTVEWEDGIGAIWMRGIDLEGRVFFSIGDEDPQLWRGGSEPVPITGEEYHGQDPDQWPRGVIIYTYDNDEQLDGYGVYGTVDDSGHFERVGLLPSPLSGWWSNSGHAFVYADLDHDSGVEAAWVDRVDDGRSVQLGVPEEAAPHIVGWESAESVILWHRQDGVSVVLRCSAVDGHCERTPNGPEPGSQATMPNRFN